MVPGSAPPLARLELCRPVGIPRRRSRSRPRALLGGARLHQARGHHRSDRNQPRDVWRGRRRVESRRHGAEVEALIFWNRFGRELHLLPYFGAIPVNERVVVDGAWVFAAGVTAGIDGALRLAAELRA